VQDGATPWGLKVLRYEITEVSPDARIREAMDKQAAAERNRREKVLCVREESSNGGLCDRCASILYEPKKREEEKKKARVCVFKKGCQAKAGNSQRSHPCRCVRWQVLGAEGNKQEAELQSQGYKIRLINESEGDLIQTENAARASKLKQVGRRLVGCFDERNRPPTLALHAAR
jgi:regulator of protease activity HflC (stomatin/prohibitin superfamily)